MEFDLNEDQRALQDSVARLLAKSYGFEQRRTVAASEQGWSRPVWDQLAELGICSLLVPEEQGGFGGSALDLLAVMPELGGTLALEPYLASAVLGATALKTAASASLQTDLLPEVATGHKLLGWAHDEENSRHAPLWVEVFGRSEGDRWLLSGKKCNVLHGTSVDQLVVSARVSGQPGEIDGLAIFLVDASAKGLLCTGHRLVDDTVAAEVRFEDTEATLLCLDSKVAWATVEATQAIGIAAVCADSLGAMEASWQLTTSYLQTRQQFGRPIGENQALRHRAAEMYVSLEMCRSMAVVAAVAASSSPSEETRTDLMRAKLMIGRHGRSLCHAAIQLHGGIGMTEEYAVGHYLRRITLNDQLFGDVDAQVARLGAALIG
jgi:pimeloyl-CoA dehydrogenase